MSQVVKGREVNERERWLHENPETLAQVQEGIDQAKRGEFVPGPDIVKDQNTTFPKDDLIPLDLSGIPGAVTVLNSLVDNPSVQDLEADLVFIKIPGGIGIDVSWYPEHDPSGNYYITAFRENEWDEPLSQLTADNPQDVPQIVRDMATFSTQWARQREGRPTPT